MGQKVNPHGLRVGVIISLITLLKIMKSEHTLRKSYTAQVFLRLKSKDHLTE